MFRRGKEGQGGPQVPEASEREGQSERTNPEIFFLRGHSLGVLLPRPFVAKNPNGNYLKLR